MLDTGIVRNRAKIEATIAGARAWLVIQERGGFSRFLWDFVDGRPVQTNAKTRKDVPTETEVSRRISKALKQEGFNFVGPTIVYAFMQAVGMVNDHLTGCYRHAECKAMAHRAEKWSRFSASNDTPIKKESIESIPKVDSTFGSDAPEKL